MGPGKLKPNRRTHHGGPNIPTVDLERPVPFLPDGRGPVVVAVPAARGGLIGEAVLVELKERAKREARKDRRRRGRLVSAAGFTDLPKGATR